MEHFAAVAAAFLAVLLAAACAAAAAFWAKLSAARARLGALEAERDRLAGENSSLLAAKSALETRAAVAAERGRSAEEKAAEFEAFSAKVFESARARFESSNKVQLDAVLSPLKEDIKAFRRRIEDLNAEGELRRGSMEAQIKSLGELNSRLSADAENLARALKGQNKTAGNWGEMVLERLLESCGLSEGFTFVREDSHTQDGARLRPDVVVKLPGGRNFIIDSKVSLVHYERFCSATDGAAREAALRLFSESVRRHVRGLSEKKYEAIEGLENPDFVMMFVPIESAFSLAVSSDPGLMDFAYQLKVAVAGPSTMLATLRTVETVWRTERQTKNTMEIARQGGALYDKVKVFLSKFEKIGRGIETLSNDYAEARVSLSDGRGNVLSSAEKLRRLGARTKGRIESKLLEDLEDE